MSNGLLTVLTIRCASTRYPNKALELVEGVPLTAWIIKRLKRLPGNLILATTNHKEDDPLEEIARNLSIDVLRYDGDENDVLGRMAAALRCYPEATHILRGLGDMPFPNEVTIKRGLAVLQRTGKEVFQYYLSSSVVPLYGSREFAISRTAFERIVKNAKKEEREHPDLWLHRNRERFTIAYHEPPPTTLFRDYRLEVDMPNDLFVIRQIAKNVGMLADIESIVHYLDRNWDVAKFNYGIPEKTGPKSSYDYALQRKWFSLMTGCEIETWTDGIVWKPPASKSVPVFCNAGFCLLGWGEDGILYTKEGHRLGGADWITCECGSGKFWRPKIQRN